RLHERILEALLRVSWPRQSGHGRGVFAEPGRTTATRVACRDGESRSRAETTRIAIAAAERRAGCCWFDGGRIRGRARQEPFLASRARAGATNSGGKCAVSA